MVAVSGTARRRGKPHIGAPGLMLDRSPCREGRRPQVRGKFASPFVNRNGVEGVVHVGMQVRVEKAVQSAVDLKRVNGNAERSHGVPDAQAGDLRVGERVFTQSREQICSLSLVAVGLKCPTISLHESSQGEFILLVRSCR
jgi:hypothetical protein